MDRYEYSSKSPGISNKNDGHDCAENDLKDDQCIRQADSRSKGTRSLVSYDDPSGSRKAFVQHLCHHPDVRIHIRSDDHALIDVGNPELAQRCVESRQQEGAQVEEKGSRISRQTLSAYDLG